MDEYCRSHHYIFTSSILAILNSSSTVPVGIGQDFKASGSRGPKSLSRVIKGQFHASTYKPAGMAHFIKERN